MESVLLVFLNDRFNIAHNGERSEVIGLRTSQTVERAEVLCRVIRRCLV